MHVFCFYCLGRKSRYLKTHFLVLTYMLMIRWSDMTTLCKLAFLYKEKEKCSVISKEIVFHYRRLGDERVVFYPFGLLALSVICQRTHAPISAFTVDTSICLSDRWCQAEKGRGEGRVVAEGCCEHITSWWTDVSATFQEPKCAHAFC